MERTRRRPARDYFRVEDKSGLRFWLFRAGLYRDLATAPRRRLVPARDVCVRILCLVGDDSAQAVLRVFAAALAAGNTRRHAIDRMVDRT